MLSLRTSTCFRMAKGSNCITFCTWAAGRNRQSRYPENISFMVRLVSVIGFTSAISAQKADTPGSAKPVSVRCSVVVGGAYSSRKSPSSVQRGSRL